MRRTTFTAARPDAVALPGVLMPARSNLLPNVVPSAARPVLRPLYLANERTPAWQEAGEALALQPMGPAILCDGDKEGAAYAGVAPAPASPSLSAPPPWSPPQPPQPPQPLLPPFFPHVAAAEPVEPVGLARLRATLPPPRACWVLGLSLAIACGIGVAAGVYGRNGVEGRKGADADAALPWMGHYEVYGRHTGPGCMANGSQLCSPLVGGDWDVTTNARGQLAVRDKALGEAPLVPSDNHRYLLVLPSASLGDESGCLQQETFAADVVRTPTGLHGNASTMLSQHDPSCVPRPDARLVSADGCACQYALEGARTGVPLA